MKKIVALLLALVMVLSMAACGKNDPGTDEPETSKKPETSNTSAADPTVEVVEDDEFTHTFTQFGNARIKIVGAEATENALGEDVLCIYFDYTNTDNIADDRCPFWALKILGITQDGEECDTYFLGEDSGLNIQPGCTNRNTLSIRWNPDGGVVKVSCYVMIGSWFFKNDEIEPFEFEIDPDNLMGVPAPFELPAITEPTYTSNMSASGEWDIPLNCEGSINGIELTRDRNGRDVVRVNLTVTNRDEEKKNAGILAGVLLYQDGVALQYVTYPVLEHVSSVVLKDEDVIDSDKVYIGYEVSPGETVECSALFYPRTKSPVEAVIEDKNSDKRLGACFDLESAYAAAEAEAAAAADAAEAASAADKAAKEHIKDVLHAAAAEAASAADKAILAELIGTWDLNDDFPEQITFNADLTGVHDIMGDQYPFTYSVSDGVLSLTYDDGDATDYEISVSGNDLVLTDPIFQEEQTFVRAGTN